MSYAAFAPTAPHVDGGRETSINWEDSPAALKLPAHLCQGGIARVSRHKIEDTFAKMREGSGMKLERREDPMNPSNIFHGNIVYEVGKAREREFASVIALLVESVEEC